LTHELLNYHPLVNTMTTSIARAGLMTFLKACGHEPRIEAASEAPTPAAMGGGDKEGGNGQGGPG
jgi:Ala-tRNA(Pro) deacylase